MYTIVEFESSKAKCELSIVPLLWLAKQETRCYFPLSTRGQNFEDFVRKETPHKGHWPQYRIAKVHYKTGDYNKAEAQLEKILESNEERISSGDSSAKSMSIKVVDNNISPVNTSDEEDEQQSHLIAKQQKPLVQKQKDVVVAGSKFQRSVPDETPAKAPDNPDIVPPIIPAEVPTPTPAPIPASCICGFRSEFEKMVLKQLAKISANVEQNTQVLAELARQTSRQDVILPPNDTPDFPLKSYEEFQDLEAKLKEPGQAMLKSYMVRRLAAVGGSGIEQLTRRMMKYLITNELGVLFNWKGRDKIGFEKTNLMSVIYEAAKINYPPSEQSDKSIAGAVAGWLKLSKARCKRLN